MDHQTVERSIWIKAPCDRVWEAITHPDQLVQWFVPNLPGATMKRDDQGKIQVFLGEMGVDILILDMLDAKRQVTLRGLPDQLLAAACTFTDQDGGTQVQISVGGFDRLLAEANEDRRAQVGAAWDKTLQNLKAFVDDAALPFPQAYVGPLFGYWREPLKRQAIERSVWINGSHERVWSAITDPKQLQAWYSPATVWQLSALEIGGRFYAHNAETDAEQYVEIIEVLDPPRQLVTRTTPEPPDTIVKTKMYTLTEENQGTRLTVTLTGYEPEADDARWGHMEQDAFGFGMMLQNVKAYLEGEALPFPWGF
jgi:uncharacterized protein YndB with AHSA1/START domain